VRLQDAAGSFGADVAVLAQVVSHSGKLEFFYFIFQIIIL